MVAHAAAAAAGTNDDEIETHLHDVGAVIAKGVVKRATCHAALRRVNARLARAMAESGQSSTAADVDSGNSADAAAAAPPSDDVIDASARYFGNVASPPHRRDLKLSLTREIKACLDELLASVVGPTMRNVLTDDAELCELSALVSDPGAGAQNLHPDTQITGPTAHCALLTAFLALQDVAPEMGPTEVVPRSHTAAAHAALSAGDRGGGGGGEGGGIGGGGGEGVGGTSGEGDSAGGEAALLAGGWLPPQPALLDAGDVLLMDSRAIHRGSANVGAGGRRVLMYASFQVPNNAPPGSTYSMLEEYQGRFRLRSHERWRDPNAEAEAEAETVAEAEAEAEAAGVS